MTAAARRAWLLDHQVGGPAARVVAYTVPAAGAGAASHRPLAESAPPGMAALTVRLPGREGRLTEPAFNRMPDLVGTVGHQLAAHLAGHGLPFLLLGDCAGAYPAYELGRALERRGLPPLALVVVGMVGPGARGAGRLHRLPAAQFRRALRDGGLVAEEVAGDDALFAMFEPTLRADWQLTETYRWDGSGRPAFPISVLPRGPGRPTADELSRSWAAATLGPTRVLTDAAADRSGELATLRAELGRLTADAGVLTAE
jgi:medium-chain acyl-[acyl-carrier-protein] hydrolase